MVLSLAETLLLGLVAGGTIVLGLPIGRVRSAAVGLRTFLNTTAVGVLLFLFWDVLSAAWAPLDTGLVQMHGGAGSWTSAIGLAVVLLAALGVSLTGLAQYEQRMKGAVFSPAMASLPGSSEAPLSGPGTPLMAKVASRRSANRGLQARSSAVRLAVLIAVGIGLHNFAEGLAIGQSAASGQVALASVLIVGFALHNATEGFGVVAPLAAEGPVERPSWRLLGLLALIAGGPTFVGTLIGYAVTNEYLSVAFLGLAAGSILYVVTQLLAVAQKARRPDLLSAGLLVGLVAGFATDAVVTLAGV